MRTGLWVCLLLLALAGSSAAQSTMTGSLQGTIKDAEGGMLPGAMVTVFSEALVARKATAVTDARGGYRFPSLPPGTYAVEAELSGFRKARQDDVRIRLGGALSVDLVMQLATVAEQVTVTGEAPVVSVVSNTVSTYYDKDFLDRQPLPRNFYAILAATPGVNNDTTGGSSSMLAYGGTSDRQNAYNLDGVNVSDPAGGSYWLLPSIQWMDEIQVGGLGANAEYGGYTGGIINGVTKSGGNSVRGGVEVYYAPSSFYGNNSGSETQKFKFTDYAVSVGGPVVKDSLWYFLSAEYWNQVTTPLNALQSVDRKVPRFLGKLTWQANTANRLQLMLEHDGLTQDYTGISESTLPDATTREESPNYTGALNWESLLSPSSFVNVKFTGFAGRLDYLPYHGKTTPGRVDENTGIAWLNAATTLESSRKKMTLDGSWSLFKDGLFGGKDSHSFKFGGAYEWADVEYFENRNGGFTYFDDSSMCDSEAQYFANPACGAYYVERGYGEYNQWNKFTGMALYAQDTLRLDRLTVNVGVRYGAYKGGWKAGHGTSTVYDVNFLDPRIGFVWDVTGDSRTALKAHWGRYHGGMFVYLYDREASGKATTPSQDCYWNSDTNTYDDCETPTAQYATMGKTNHPYVDESILTFEHQTGQDFAVGLDLIDRRFRSYMAMVNVNDDYTLKNIAGNPLTGGSLPVWDLGSPPQFVLTTDNAAANDYRSAILRVDKRYSHGWQGRASLAWTDVKGNIISAYGYAAEFRDKNGLTNAYGRMDLGTFAKWEFKLSAAVDLPLGFQLSGQYSYWTGQYWTPYVRVSGLDYNSSTGRDINLVPRGTNQFENRQLVDLRLAWSTTIAKTLRLTASFEGFNVLNADTVLDVYNRWGSVSFSKGTWSKRSNFGDPYTIEKPRELRAGIRLEF